jgi:hypothetical protein
MKKKLSKRDDIETYFEKYPDVPSSRCANQCSGRCGEMKKHYRKV